jgi:Transglycosylase SLT domain
MQRHAALLARIERQFGVPATLLMAIWTLESDNALSVVADQGIAITKDGPYGRCEQIDLLG